MEQRIIVSIIVPTYRREHELKRALDSIASLEFDSYEIILVDDNVECSWNEKVQDIVEMFRKGNPQIELKYIVNSENKGSAKTRNIGIQASKGEYICFLDDDDVYLPKRIKNQLGPMLKENADYSITDLALYNERDKLIEVRQRKYIQKTSKEDLMKYHLMYHMTGTDTLMFKREYLLDIGTFDPIDVGDEFYLMCKAIEHNGNFLYVSTCDVKAYVHDAGGGISSGATKIDGENKLYEYKKNYFEQLEGKAIKYVKTRHHLVLGLAYLKERKWVGFIREGVYAFFTDYKSCCSIILNRK